MVRQNVIILGGGFIAHNLLEYLSSKGLNVILYNSAKCNLLSYDEIECNLARMDREWIVIICASITRLKENSFRSLEDNVLMIRNISKFINQKSPKQIIFFSSIDIYGNNLSSSINEETMILPEDYYATSKAVSELLLKAVCSQNDIELLIFRLPGVFGKYDMDKSTIYSLVYSALTNGKINVYGNDSREFVYIKNLVQIVFNGIINSSTGIYNVGFEKSYGMKEIADLVANKIGLNVNIEHFPLAKSKRVQSIAIDNSKLKNSSLFDRINIYRLEDAIENYITGDYIGYKS